jgi:hypothetical protein
VEVVFPFLFLFLVVDFDFDSQSQTLMGSIDVHIHYPYPSFLVIYFYPFPTLLLRVHVLVQNHYSYFHFHSPILILIPKPYLVIVDTHPDPGVVEIMHRMDRAYPLMDFLVVWPFHNSDFVQEGVVGMYVPVLVLRIVVEVDIVGFDIVVEEGETD